MNLTNMGIRVGIRLLSRALRHRSYLQALSSSYVLMLILCVMQFVFIPLYLRNFGQYQFGVLIVLLSLINFAGIGIAWLGASALRILGEYAGHDDNAGFLRAFGLTKALYIGYGLVVAGVLLSANLLFGQSLFSGGQATDVDVAQKALLLTAVYAALFYPATIDRLALISRKRQGAANMVQLAGTVVFIAGVLFWLAIDGDMAGIIVCQILGTLVSILISRHLLHRELPALCFYLPSWQDERDLLQRLGGRTGLGFFLHSALILLLLSDTMLIGWLGGAKVAAEFYLVWKVAEAIVQVISKLPEALGPYFVHMDVRNEHHRLNRIAQIGYLLVAGIALFAGIFYALFGQQLVALWIGQAQPPSTSIAFILAGAAIFWLSIARLPIVLAHACVSLRALNVASGFELCGKLIFTLLLFPHLGYQAVLLGINLVHLLGGGYLYFSVLRNISVTAKYRHV